MADTSEKSLAVGIDFGGTSIKVAVVRGAEIVSRGNRITTGDYDSPDNLIAAMAVEIQNLRREHPEIRAVGVGLPGWCDHRTGFVANLTNVPGWRSVEFTRKMAQHLDLPVTIDNDATSMAYAEWKFGAARNSSNAVCLTMGTGVGGGLILDGRLHRGSKMSAGEIGMNTVDMHGVEGPYGNHGFVEGYVGHARIARRAQQLYAEAGKPRDIVHCDPIPLEVAARQGDPVALQVWNETAERMGAMLADLIWTLSIDTIVVGGGVANAGDLLFQPMRKSIEGRVPEFFHDFALLPAHFSNDAGIIGCANLALEVSNR